jgi:hypothetical protein
MTGVPVMSILFPLLYEFLYEHFSLFGAIFIMGAVQLNVCVGATFFRPITLASDGQAQDVNLFVKLKKAFGRLLRLFHTFCTGFSRYVIK